MTTINSHLFRISVTYEINKFVERRKGFMNSCLIKGEKI